MGRALCLDLCGQLFQLENLTPSKADLAATMELKALSERLGVPLLDHLVIGAEEDGGFVSLAERNG